MSRPRRDTSQFSSSRKDGRSVDGRGDGDTGGVVHTTAIVRTSRFAERPSNGQRVFFEPKMRPSFPSLPLNGCKGDRFFFLFYFPLSFSFFPLFFLTTPPRENSASSSRSFELGYRC